MVLTRGKTIYFFDPSGNRNEVFAEDSYVYPDSPVLTWNADNVGQAIFYHSRELVDSFMGVTS
jgi:catechol 2,3-dioxygenase (EC 1.13.11.2)